MVYLYPYKKGIKVLDGDRNYTIRRPIFSVHNYRNLKNRTLIIGYVGPRGSGKSVGADSLVITDFMLKGKTVWSNMKIEFCLVKPDGKLVHMESQPLDRLSLVDLDQVYHNGLIYVDEVNLMMEARRSMATENVNFSYVLQQLRKRKLTIVWSAQSEMHCDDRLRFQTDIFIMCQDISIVKPNCGVGELSSWKAHDMSGIVTGKNPMKSDDAVFYQGVQWNKPWWNTYNTWEIQEVKTISADEQRRATLSKEAGTIAEDMAEYLRQEGIDEIPSTLLWKQWDVTEHNMRAMVGAALTNKHNIHKKDYNSRSNMYVVDEEDSEIDNTITVS